MGPKKQKRKQNKILKVNDNERHNCIIHFDEYGDDHKFLQISEERFTKLRKLAVLKSNQQGGSSEAHLSACNQIPDYFEAGLGYHRKCYQKFTRNTERLVLNESETCTDTKLRRRTNENIEKTKFKEDCIFCNRVGPKKTKTKGQWKKENVQGFLSNDCDKILQKAEEKEDEQLAIRIRNFDLTACGAKFHKSCRYAYMSSPCRWRSNNESQKELQNELEMAHSTAFNRVCEIIREEIICNNKIMKLTDLRHTYVEILANTEYANSEYRSEKLKRKIECHKDLSSLVGFVRLETTSKFQSYLLFSRQIELATAVKNAYILGENDRVKEAAIEMRNTVLNAFNKVESTSWPPDVKYLNNKDILPDELKAFLNILCSGKDDNLSQKKNRIVLSLGQDICRAITNAEWKLPKHIMLCMTLRHLFRSKELITILNRLGHCENHSFSLELETAIANSIEQSSSVLSNQIIRRPIGSSVFHSEFDNFDQLINDVSGSGSIHTAHGIMMQELTRDEEQTSVSIKEVPREKKRSLDNSVPVQLEECYVTQRRSPVLCISSQSVKGTGTANQAAEHSDIAWLISRVYNEEEQCIPGWGGFVSVTGSAPSRLTSLDYYPAIYHPITEYSTVQECLNQAQKATDEVGQHFVYSTFDLGVCMKAFPLIWNNPLRFSRHVVMIGTFHLTMGYLNMLGKKMDGSGFTDVLLEANLISSGSLHGVVTGKNYIRAMNCHKVLTEALHRLLLVEFSKSQGCSTVLECLPTQCHDLILSMTENISKETLSQLICDDVVLSKFEEYIEFCENVRNGHLGKTGQFWMSYIDHVSLILKLIRAVKTNNFELYCHCISGMCNLFFSYGGHNYARYLTYFSTFIANLEHSHPGALNDIKLGVISVARSFVPGNRCEVDKTMEETLMKNSKSKGGAGGGSVGISGITKNYSAYQRWIRTMHERTKYLDGIHALTDLNETNPMSVKHKDVRQSEIKKSEAKVKETIDALNNFVNPFNINDKESLYSISSGVKVPTEMERDILCAEQIGSEAKVRFIEDRLKVNDKFFEPIKKFKLGTMAALGKTVKLTTKQNKVVELKQTGNIAFQLLVKSQSIGRTVDLQEVMKYQLTPVPYCLGTSDGFLGKTNKSKGMHYLTASTENAEPPESANTLLIIDGNAVFHMLSNVPDTFGDIAVAIFKSVPKSGDIVFSTDAYHANSIKSQERKRRGCSERYLVKGPSVKKPANWKDFLTNDENKETLVDMLLTVWSENSFAENLKDRKVILVAHGKAFMLTSENGETVDKEEVHELISDQEETDTRVVLYAAYGAKKGYKNVKIKSPDTDVFFILLNHASQVDTQIYFDTGKGNSRRLLNITNMSKKLGQLKCSSLLSLHAFTGCDTTSAFKGIGKVKPVKILQKMQKFEICLHKLGESWDLDDNAVAALEHFTCCIYGYPRITSLNALRLHLLKKKCVEDDKIDPKRTVDLAALPPCLSTLIEHVKRTNFQVKIWKSALENYIEVPNPLDHGWNSENNTLVPQWCSQEVLPRYLTELLDGFIATEEEDKDLVLEYDSDESDGEI